jgi:hypothetical protein
MVMVKGIPVHETAAKENRPEHPIETRKQLCDQFEKLGIMVYRML